MPDSAASALMFALFNLGGGEVILILALVLILFGAKNLPDISRGLCTGIFDFWKHVRDLSKGVDRKAHDAGEALGGIYGKPAAQALTPDNLTAELYDPGVFRKRSGKRNGTVRRFLRILGLLWIRARKLIVRCVRAFIGR